MKATFFIALISLAAFVQAAPTPQGGGTGTAGAVGSILDSTNGFVSGAVNSALGGAGGNGGSGGGKTGGKTGGDEPGDPTGDDSGPDGAEARSVKEPALWRRQASAGGTDGTGAAKAVATLADGLATAAKALTGTQDSAPPPDAGDD